MSFISWSYIDWLLLLGYFVVLTFAGFYFYVRGSSVDFFLGRGRVPAIVSALSIYATLLSSVSYLAIPAAIYTDGWVMGLSPLGAAIFLVLVAKFIVPKFRNVDIYSVYDFLEYRFSQKLKLIASLSFVIFHIIRIAIVIFLPTLSFQLILPEFSVIWILILTAVFCTAYSSLAGIIGISYIDSLQTILFVIGALVVMWIGFSLLPENVSFLEALAEKKKLLNSEHFSLSIHKNSFWGVTLGQGIFGSVYLYIASQDIFQRYKITPSLKAAQRSVLYNIPLLFISIFIFIGMGSALIIFFNYGPNLPSNLNSNAILPYFIINFLPTGLSGLLVITILAATQSTLSSSINATTLCIIKDLGLIHPKYSKLKQAQIISLLIGILGVCLAYYFIKIGQSGIFKFIVSVSGQICGPIAALFIAGLFFPKIQTNHAYLGLIIGSTFSFYTSDPLELKYPNLNINPFVIPFMTIFITFMPAYFASILWCRVLRVYKNFIKYIAAFGGGGAKFL